MFLTVASGIQYNVSHKRVGVITNTVSYYLRGMTNSIAGLLFE
jgi:hypothetical protein